MLRQDIDAREKFLFTLTWLLELQVRYPNNIRFGLLHVEFQDLPRLGAAYGVQEAMNMLVNLTHAMRNAFRKSDLVARDGTGVWVLVPFTSPETVVAKAAEIVKVGAENGLDIVEHSIQIYSLPEDIQHIAERTPIERFLECLKSSNLGQTVSSYSAKLQAAQ